MSLSIRLLGRPTIRAGNEEPRPVRGHQAWALLARLVLSERPLERRQLASELFPDTADPLGAVRWALASLRSAIGGEALTGDPVQLNLPAGTTVDVWEVEREGWDVEAAGDLLDGVEARASATFDTWLLIERERIASRVDARLRQEAMAALSAGDGARAVRLAGLGVRRRPLDEGAHVLLVRSLVLDGREEAARAQAEATERTFLAELGEKPSAALRAALQRKPAPSTEGVSPRAAIESLLEAGAAALAAGAAEAGLDCLRRAAAQAEAAKDEQLSARALMELGAALVHAVRGYDEEGAILLRGAADLARRCGSADIACGSLRELGYVEALAGRRPTAAQLLEAALAAGGDDRDRLAAVHAVTAFNLVDWGRVEEGLAHFETSLELARATGNRRRQIWSLGIGSWAQLAAGRPEAARDWAQDCLDACEDLRWLAFRPWPFAVLSEARLRLGEDPLALRPGLEEAFALSRHLGDPCWEGATARCMALTHAARREYGVAKEWLARARQDCCRVTDPYAGLMVEILADQVKVSRSSGDEDEARALTRELIAAAARSHADAHLRQAMAAPW